jgi:hypothetical protein
MSVQLLCLLGAKEAVPTVVGLIETEPEATFTQLWIQSWFGYLAQQGLGYELRQKLSDRLANAQTADMQARFTRVIEFLRGTDWAK